MFTPAMMFKRFRVGAADFDGTNDFMRRGADLTGNVDGKSGIFSAWMRIDGEPNNAMRLFCSAITIGDTTTRLQVERGGFGGGPKYLSVIGRKSAGTDILRLDTTAVFTISTSWIHLLSSWDLANGKGHLYVNDVADIDGATDVLINDAIDYATADWAVGAAASGSFKFNGCLAEVYFAPNQYLDFSVASNRRKFRTSTGKPVNLGVDGSVPTGVAPLVYLHLNSDEAVASFATNRGAGGNFSITGTLDSGSTSPSD